MDKQKLFEFYKNNIERNWSNLMTLPDPSKLRAQFEKFYKTRMEIITLMSHDFRHNTTKF